MRPNLAISLVLTLAAQSVAASPLLGQQAPACGGNGGNDPEFSPLWNPLLPLSSGAPGPAANGIQDNSENAVDERIMWSFGGTVPNECPNTPFTADTFEGFVDEAGVPLTITRETTTLESGTVITAFVPRTASGFPAYSLALEPPTGSVVQLGVRPRFLQFARATSGNIFFPKKSLFSAPPASTVDEGPDLLTVELQDMLRRRWIIYEVTTNLGERPYELHLSAGPEAYAKVVDKYVTQPNIDEPTLNIQLPELYFYGASFGGLIGHAHARYHGWLYDGVISVASQHDLRQIGDAAESFVFIQQHLGRSYLRGNRSVGTGLFPMERFRWDRMFREYGLSVGGASLITRPDPSNPGALAVGALETALIQIRGAEDVGLRSFGNYLPEDELNQVSNTANGTSGIDYVDMYRLPDIGHSEGSLWGSEFNELAGVSLADAIVEKRKELVVGGFSKPAEATSLADLDFQAPGSATPVATTEFLQELTYEDSTLPSPFTTGQTDRWEHRVPVGLGSGRSMIWRRIGDLGQPGFEEWVVAGTESGDIVRLDLLRDASGQLSRTKEAWRVPLNGTRRLVGGISVAEVEANGTYRSYAMDAFGLLVEFDEATGATLAVRQFNQVGQVPLSQTFGLTDLNVGGTPSLTFYDSFGTIYQVALDLTTINTPGELLHEHGAVILDSVKLTDSKIAYTLAHGNLATRDFATTFAAAPTLKANTGVMLSDAFFGHPWVIGHTYDQGGSEIICFVESRIVRLDGLLKEDGTTPLPIVTNGSESKELVARFGRVKVPDEAGEGNDQYELVVGNFPCQADGELDGDPVFFELDLDFSAMGSSSARNVVGLPDDFDGYDDVFGSPLDLIAMKAPPACLVFDEDSPGRNYLAPMTDGRLLAYGAGSAGGALGLGDQVSSSFGLVNGEAAGDRAVWTVPRDVGVAVNAFGRIYDPQTGGTPAPGSTNITSVVHTKQAQAPGLAFAQPNVRGTGLLDTMGGMAMLTSFNDGGATYRFTDQNVCGSVRHLDSPPGNGGLGQTRIVSEPFSVQDRLLSTKIDASASLHVGGSAEILQLDDLSIGGQASSATSGAGQAGDPAGLDLVVLDHGGQLSVYRNLITPDIGSEELPADFEAPFSPATDAEFGVEAFGLEAMGLEIVERPSASGVASMFDIYYTTAYGPQPNADLQGALYHFECPLGGDPVLVSRLDVEFGPCGVHVANLDGDSELELVVGYAKGFVEVYELDPSTGALVGGAAGGSAQPVARSGYIGPFVGAYDSLTSVRYPNDDVWFVCSAADGVHGFRLVGDLSPAGGL